VDGKVTNLLGCHADISAGGANWDMESGIGRVRVDHTYNSTDLVKDIIQVA
jgi:hypothetical protein